MASTSGPPVPPTPPVYDLPLPPTSAMTLGEAATYLLEDADAFADLGHFLEGLVAALARDDVPLDRGHIVLTTMHPEVAALAAIWRRDQPVEIIPRPWSGLASQPFQRSPIRCLHEGTHRVIRRHLCDPTCADDFDIVDDLRGQGFTDYLTFALGHRHARRINSFSCATRQPGGFTDAQLHLLMSLQRLLSVVVDAWVDHRISDTLLRTYLGDDAGGRVLDGQVRRGEGEDIPAVIAFCDLRNFTVLSDTLPRRQLLTLLDDTFDAVVTAIHHHGGEVLKFIGDAVLAIFRAEPANTDAACKRAIDAAHDVMRRVAEKNGERQSRDAVPISVGVSLHVGEVHYGNIGGPARLDFTVVGPAVNIASRLQSLCASLKQPIVMSEAFAQHLQDPGDDAGEYLLKGVQQPMRIFVPHASTVSTTSTTSTTSTPSTTPTQEGA